MVILIIGMLIAGISQGIDLYQDAKLSTARTLTKNSRVNRIPDLELWLETTLDESFISSEKIHNSNISSWLDINNQSNFKKSVSQSTTAQKPKYILQAFDNSLPAVQFDGSNDNFPFNSTYMNGADFTIFVVEQRRSASNLLYFIGGGGSGVFHLGYANTSTIRAGQYGTANVNFFIYYLNHFKTSEIIPRIHTFILSTTNGKKYWINGGSTPDKSSNDLTSLSNFSGYIGVTGYAGENLGSYYNGDIGEIIIFSRELTDKERIDVEKYLSKKFNISLS